ncbi:hypothetical protein LEN26_007651 [Aphanomyces euteiches]|nr:hypothetical protein LEN26_007651 [Aphanomyces euteiches]
MSEKSIAVWTMDMELCLIEAFKKYVTNLSGFGDGFTDDKWAELDATRSKIKLARFRDRPFAHYEAMSAILGDTIATGVDTANTTSDALLSSSTDLEHGNLSAAQKRANVLHRLKMNKKKKRDESRNYESKKRLKVIQQLSNSVSDLLKLYAIKNGLEHALSNHELEVCDNESD